MDQKLGRNSVGIVIVKEYVDLAIEKINSVGMGLFEENAKYGKRDEK